MSQTVKNLPAMWEIRVQSLVQEDPLRKWQPTPVFLPGEFHGQSSLDSYSPPGCRVGHNCATGTFIGNNSQYFVSFKGKESEKKNIYIYSNHIAVHLKLTQYCKSTILQFFKTALKKKSPHSRISLTGEGNYHFLNVYSVSNSLKNST